MMTVYRTRDGIGFNTACRSMSVPKGTRRVPYIAQCLRGYAIDLDDNLCDIMIERNHDATNIETLAFIGDAITQLNALSDRLYLAHNDEVKPSFAYAQIAHELADLSTGFNRLFESLVPHFDLDHLPLQQLKGYALLLSLVSDTVRRHGEGLEASIAYKEALALRDGVQPKPVRARAPWVSPRARARQAYVERISEHLLYA